MHDRFDPVPACFSGVQFLPIPRLERIVIERLNKYQNSTGRQAALPIPIEDCVELVEKIPVEAFEGVEQFPSEVLGAYDFRQKVMLLREDISHEGRKRFTMAHEYGHFVLHAGHYLQQVFDFYSEGDSNHIQLFCGLNSTRNQLEWQANSFASHFLMPTHLLQEEFGSRRQNIGPSQLQSEVSERAEVSLQAAGIRLKELGWVN